MFWFLAIITTFGYVTQSILMAHHVRKIDALSAGFYRNITFFITLLPLLFFTSWEKILGITHYFDLILLAAAIGAIGQWMSFLAIQRLPLGINSALISGVGTIFTFIWAFLFFGEVVTMPQIIFVVIILLGSIIFALSKKEFLHLKSKEWFWGIFYRILSSALTPWAFILIAKVARDLDPFTAGYFWEVTIAICILVIIFTRQLSGGAPLEKISKKEFFKIGIISSPTLIGTGAFFLASKIGPVGIITAIGAGGIVLSALLSWALYNEKFYKIHWFATAIVILGIIGLKIVT